MTTTARSSEGCGEGACLNSEAFQRRLSIKDKTRRPADSLTPREKTVVARLAMGLSNAEIAGDLKISIQTVKNHLGSIFDKVGVASRLELAAWLFSHDLELDPLQTADDPPQHQKGSMTGLRPSIPEDVSSNPWRVS